MSYSFSGPSVVGLFPAVIGAACAGWVYKAIANTNSSPIYILMIREVADFSLYQLTVFLADSPRGRAILYAGTNLIVNLGTYAVLRHKQLIGVAGTALFVCLVAIELLCKIFDFPHYRASE